MPEPQIKMLPVRTVQFANPPTVQAPQQRPGQQAAPSPAPPAITGRAAETSPAAELRVAAVPTADGANARPSAKPQTGAASGASEMFFLLVVGMGLASFALAVVIKMAGSQRALPLEDPDSAWRRYRKDHQRPAPDAADAFTLPARSGRPAPQPQRPVSTWIELLAAGRKELAPALRAIGEWRRREAA